MNRVCCASWFWCQVLMSPINSVLPPSPSSQLCQYHCFCPTCPSVRRRVTATRPPIVTCGCIFTRTYNVMQSTFLFACFFASLIVCPSLCFEHNSQTRGIRCQWGWSDCAQNSCKASCGFTRLGEASTCVMVPFGLHC